MRATEALYFNLYGVEMKYGKVDIPKEKVFNCFFIVEHFSEISYIEKQAMELLLAGGKAFAFYGEYCETWHDTFELMDTRLFVDGIQKKTEDSIGAVNCKDIVELAENIFETISCRTFIPCVNILIYDDELLYKQTCRQIEWLKQQSILFHKVRVALKRMNPYGLLPEAPVNEFYGEAAWIAGEIKVTDTVQKIATVMARVLTESFDDTFTVKGCMEYAKDIVVDK